MKNRNINVITQLCCAILFLVMAHPASAHFPWVSLSDYTLNNGAKLKGTIGWGHHYPTDGFLKKDDLQSLTLIGPSKDTPAIAFTSELELATAEGVSTEGGYIVAAERKPGFYTKTTNGHKSASKQGLEGVISCSHSSMAMKAVANMGKPGNVSAVVGHPLEIIPLDNPANLKVGDYLHLQVLFNGKPFSGQVFATYSGFSNDENTFAYAVTVTKMEMPVSVCCTKASGW